MSAHILDELGLVAAADADALAAGTRAFAPVHLGLRDVRIGALLAAVRRRDGLLPPRTGHLGNWADIAEGRAGPMDFNTAICGGGHGYPLIYGLTRTEAEAEGGDEVYLPGSLAAAGERRELPLHTWDGRAFVRRDRSRPLFCPLTQTEVDGELTALVELHWRRLPRVPGYRFVNWARSLLDNERPLVEMLTTLVAEAANGAHPDRTLTELISHAARLDGEVGRCDLRHDGDGYLLDGYHYGSARELAEAVLLPLRALADPRWFFARIASMPPVLPVPSLLLTNVLFAVFGDHLPDQTGVPDEGPFITHLHWGARAMAGCPPRRHGYFARRSRVRPMRDIMTTLIRHFPAVKPVCFVLMPAQAFMLCPPSTAPEDLAVLNAVVKAVLTAEPDAAHDTARAELAVRGDRLSAYLRGRFAPERGVPRDGEHWAPATPVEPDGFRELTFRQACAIVAALEEAHGG